MRQSVLFRNLAASAAALALLVGLSGNARADVAYGFSIQGIQGLRIAGSGGGAIDLGTAAVVVSGVNSASLSDNPSVVNPGTTDALQAFVGPGLTAPGENFGLRTFPPALSAGGTTGSNGDAFANFSVASGLPAGTLPTGEKVGQPLRSFARGDMLITGTLSNIFTATGINAFNVAEAYASNAGQRVGGASVTATASGRYTITAVFTATATGGLDVLASGFSNAVYSVVNPEVFGGTTTATASFKTDYTLNNLTSGGPSVGRSPTNLNQTQSAPFNIGETLGSGGSTDFTTGAASFSIVAGQRYQLQISIEESTNVTAAIPEPGPIALAALGGLMVAAGGLRHRLARRNKVDA